MDKTMTQSLESGFQLINESGSKSKVYHIEKMLGRGGFGITYLATAEEFIGNIPQITRYTIKEFCLADICSRQGNGYIIVSEHEKEEFESSKNDFLHEAKRLYGMHHEGIVPVNEVFEANGTAYYVMQYLGELSLVKYVKENGGKLDEDKAKSIIIAIGSALGYLHQQKVTHLDVKPENIMMLKRRNGTHTPVLIDFGLACHYKKNGTSTSKHCATGISEGYSPLEQYAGIDRFSPESDIYALGATLYFMLTGSAPLKAADMSSQYLFKTLPDRLSDRTFDVLRKSMEKMAERRIKSIDEFIRELDQSDDIIKGGKVTVKRKTNKINNGVGSSNILKYGLIVLAIVIVILLVLNLRGGEIIPPKQPITADTTTNITPDTNKTEISHIAPIQQPIQQPLQPQTNNSTTINHDTNNNISTQPQKNHLELDYGVWLGPVKNGKPHGDGVMKFNSSHRIDSRDPAGNIAEAGDYIEGTYVNGHLDVGTWHKSSGGSEYLIIGQ